MPPHANIIEVFSFFWILSGAYKLLKGLIFVCFLIEICVNLVYLITICKNLPIMLTKFTQISIKKQTNIIPFNNLYAPGRNRKIKEILILNIIASDVE